MRRAPVPWLKRGFPDIFMALLVLPRRGRSTDGITAMTIRAKILNSKPSKNQPSEARPLAPAITPQQTATASQSNRSATFLLILRHWFSARALVGYGDLPRHTTISRRGGALSFFAAKTLSCRIAPCSAALFGLDLRRRPINFGHLQVAIFVSQLDNTIGAAAPNGYGLFLNRARGQHQGCGQPQS